MPRGAEDYSNVSSKNPLHRLDDMAELAARLGSPSTHERSGRIIFLDSFEYGMASWQAGAPGDSSVAVTAEEKRSKAFSVKMSAVSGNGLNSAQISRAFPYPTLNRQGLEFSVMFLHKPRYLIWTLGRRYGQFEDQYQYMYMADEKEIVVTLQGGSSKAVVEDIELYVGSGLFHTIKIVADMETNKHVRLIVNEQVIPMGDYGPNTIEHVSSPHTNVVVTLWSDNGETNTVFIDDVILTQGEP